MSDIFPTLPTLPILPNLLPRPVPRASRFPNLGGGPKLPDVPVRRVLLGAALVLSLWAGGRWVEHGFQSVAPGEAGLVVNKFTGSTRVVSPGSHFLPGSFFVLTRVRVSDQLLSGPAATFTVPTKDGFAVGLVLQARWALDRDQLLARWAGLPRGPGRRGRRPRPRVRVPGPRARVRRAVASREQARGARGPRHEAGRRAPRRGRNRPQGRPRRRPEAPRGVRARPARASRAGAARRADRGEPAASRSRRSSSSASRPRPARRAPTRRPRPLANRRLIEAKAESDAMAFILPLKEKGIKTAGARGRGAEDARA